VSIEAIRAIRAAIDVEVERIEALPTPTERFNAYGVLMKALQPAMPTCAEGRRRAVRELRSYGYSLAELADQFQMSRARVAQLLDG